MLKEAATIEEIAKEAAEYLSKYIKVDKVIIYGSYAYGEPREDSDIDLAVVSEDFTRMSVIEKIELLSGVGLAVDSRIEVKGFSRKEYDDALPASLIELIKQQGKDVAW